MEEAAGEEAGRRAGCAPELPGWGWSVDFLLEQWGPTESCGCHLRVCDRIPPATAGWGREAGVGAAERWGMAFLRFVP